MRVWLAQLEVSSNGSTIRKCKRREYELGLCCEFMNREICKSGEKEEEKSGYPFHDFRSFRGPQMARANDSRDVQFRIEQRA